MHDFLEESILRKSSISLDILGFLTLKHFYRNSFGEIRNSLSAFAQTKLGSIPPQTSICGPVESSLDLAQCIYTDYTYRILRKAVGPFWLWGSDASLSYSNFCLHRDLFTNPPIYKLFIPFETCQFLIIPGSCSYFDQFAREIGKYVTQWDLSLGEFVDGFSAISFSDTAAGLSISDASPMHLEPPIIRVPLEPGDAFLFNVNCVHGLVVAPPSSVNNFVAFSLVNSPHMYKKYSFSSRVDMFNTIVDVRTSSLVESDLEDRGFGMDLSESFNLALHPQVQDYLSNSLWSKSIYFSSTPSNIINESYSRVNGSQEFFLRNPLSY